MDAKVAVDASAWISRLMPQEVHHIAADLHLRAGDATYVAVAHQRHIPLVTWDQEQLQRAKSLIPTYTSADYPF